MSIQEDAVNLVATAHAVEHNVVVDSTRNSYINRLIEFSLWLYNHTNHHNLLTTETVENMAACIEVDTVGRRRKTLVTTRRYLKGRFARLNRRSDTTNESPIRLQGDENKLSYAVIAEFFSTKLKYQKVDIQLALKYKRQLDSYLGQAEEDLDDTVVEIEPDESGQVKIALRQDAPTYDGIRSSAILAHLYREAGVVMDENLKMNLSR